MSKEEYLKGEKKLAVFDLIRKYMAYRMRDDEMLINLEDKGHKISDRTLRRYKHEILELAGKNFTEIYKNEIIFGNRRKFLLDIYIQNLLVSRYQLEKLIKIYN